MDRETRDICRVWDEVSRLFKSKPEDWQYDMTCRWYYQRHGATISINDIHEALEQRENKR